MLSRKVHSCRSASPHRSGPQRIIFLLVLAACLPLAAAPRYDLLLRGGHVIDPRNGINEVRDVAIAAGRIAAVESSIPPAEAGRVVDATGLLVTPGLVDMHVHVFAGTEPNADYSDSFRSIPPDGFTFRAGVTTAVDAGSAGWRNFEDFKANVVDRAQTRVLAFLNVVGTGMKGGPIEQNLTDMDAKLTAIRIRQYPEILVGVKTAHYHGPEWDPVDRAVEAGRQAGVPIMVDFGQFHPARPYEELVGEHLRPGDISTHCYIDRIPMLNSDGSLRPYLVEAQKRGVWFDVGHGGGSFYFRQAVPAIKQGFWPDSISTDIHVNSMNSGMKDMANLLSKFLALGLPLEEVIARATWRPAQAIKRTDLGHLSVGAGADVAVFNVQEGTFGFVDVAGGRLDGSRKLECELTLRAGEVVWDLNGRASPAWPDVPVTPQSR